ncbi:PAS domain S-box protein [Neobacillus jeddahensis]|uniref:PAS domain S-box protein n=1 Tax=Neobacillus jeddahensis TaxID=1461580 RepID=UPI00069416BA|nr:PAS domain S-box protein [Neobacillus jeddahensis]
MTATYQMNYLLLSILIGVVASFTALDLIGRVAESKGRAKKLWLFSAALTFGLGIWAMYFTGMLVHLPQLQVSYHIGKILISLLFAMLGSWGAFLIVTHATMNKVKMISIGTLLMVGSIVAMHYIGMTSMVMKATIYYDLFYVGLAIIVAVVVSSISLVILFSIRHSASQSISRKLGVSLILGLAISSVHYSGIKATTFIPNPNKRIYDNAFYSENLETDVLISTFIILFIMLVFSFIDKQIAIRAARWGETRYKSLFDHNPDGMFTLDRDGTFQSVNPAAEKMTGYTKEELLNTTFERLIEPVEKEQNCRHFNLALQGETQVYEANCIRKDGNLRILQLKLVPMIREQEILGVYGITKDITEQKQSQKRLKESEARYKRLVKLSPEPILVHRNGRIKFANTAFTRLVGAAGHLELIGKSVIDFSPPEYEEMVKNRFQYLKKTGTFIAPAEEKVIRLNGEVLDVEVTGITLDYGDDTAVLMMVHDITSRKRVAEALRKSEYNYRLITEYSQDMIRLTDRNGIILYASPSHKWNLGIEAEDYIGKHVREGIHPDDLSLYDEKLRYAIKNQENFTIEGRRQHQNGQWIWIESHAMMVMDDHGALQHIVYSSRNIMERKQYEEKLEQLAFQDTLTGLPNRRSFTDSLKSLLQGSEQSKSIHAVMFLDLDKFKRINDTLGHDIGDELLKKFAQRIKNSLADDDILARLGGDEFTIILPNLQSEQDAQQTAERIIEELQEPWEINGHNFLTTSSIGISYYPKDGDNPKRLMKCADLALYKAKDAGRNKYQIFE